MLGGIRSKIALFCQPREPAHVHHQGDLLSGPSILRLPPRSGRQELGPETAGCRLQAVGQTPEATAPRSDILGLALPTLVQLAIGVSHRPTRNGQELLRDHRRYFCECIEKPYTQV